MKRENLPVYAHENAAEGVRRETSTWRQMHRDQRTLYHYFSNTVHSVKRDVETEAGEMLRRFHVLLLPEYEPEYLWTTRYPVEGISPSTFEVTDYEYQLRSNLDYLMADSFNSMKLVDTFELPDDLGRIVSGVRTSDDLFSLVTDDGDVVTYNPQTGEETGRVEALFKSGEPEEAKDYDGKYVFIPGAISIEEVTNQNGDVIPYTVREVMAGGRYENIYDINSNGIIDDEDLAEFRAAEGRDINNTSPEQWNTVYTKFDLNRDGRIDDSETAVVENLLWESAEDGTLIDVGEYTPMIRVLYRTIPDAEYGSVYQKGGNVRYARNNTLGSSILEKNIQGKPGRKGIAEPETANFTVELDEKGRVNFVREDGVSLYRKKLSWKDMDKFQAENITTVDDLLLLQTNFPNGQLKRLYTADLKKEAVEYTNQYIDMDTDDGEIRWVSAVNLPNNYLYVGMEAADGSQKILQYELIKKYYTIDQEAGVAYFTENTEVIISDTAAGQIVGKLEQYEPDDGGSEEPGGFGGLYIMPLVPVGVQNSVDDAAYNWGMTRLPGETNRELRTRLMDFWRHLQGNDHRGMLYGIGKEIGMPLPEVWDLRPTESTAIKLTDKWIGTRPLVFLIVDDDNRELDLLAPKFFADWSTESDTKYELTGLYSPVSDIIEIPDEFEDYQRNFSEAVASPDIVEKIILDDRTGYWDIDGDDLETDDVITYNNGVVDFKDAPSIVNEYSERRVLVFYDAADAEGNVHTRNFEYSQFPYFQPQESKDNAGLIIETLVTEGSYRDSKINDLQALEELILDIKKDDNSRWKDTVSDESFYNTAAMSGDILKQTVWSGLSFNDHFGNGTEKWEY